MEPSAKLYSITFKHNNKTQQVLCAATNPENARTYCNDLLNTLGHSDWTFVATTPIRAGIFPVGEGKIITMEDAARATA
jgi:hypothetical protein